MSALAYTVGDSTTMLRRNLRRLQRYPSLTLMLAGMPIVFLLLFVYVFGGQLSHGLSANLSGGRSGRAGYLNYVTPGILLVTVAAAVQGTAIVVAMDMTSGIIDRFRTMAIARSAVLTGHVLASLIQTLASIGVVLGVAVALGFRPTAARLHRSRRSGSSRCSPSRSSGSPLPSASPPRASRPRATRRCSSRSFPSSAAASSQPPPCRPGSGSSRTTSPSPPPPRRCAGFSPERRSARTGSSPWDGVSVSPSPRTCGPGGCTQTAAPRSTARARAVRDHPADHVRAGRARPEGRVAAVGAPRHPPA